MASALITQILDVILDPVVLAAVAVVIVALLSGAAGRVVELFHRW